MCGGLRRFAAIYPAELTRKGGPHPSLFDRITRLERQDLDSASASWLQSPQVARRVWIPTSFRARLLCIDDPVLMKSNTGKQHHYRKVSERSTDRQTLILSPPSATLGSSNVGNPFGFTGRPDTLFLFGLALRIGREEQ